MKTFTSFLNAHKYETHVAAFLLMVIPPIPLYFAARGGVLVWIWLLLGLVILGNLLELMIN